MSCTAVASDVCACNRVEADGRSSSSWRIQHSQLTWYQVGRTTAACGTVQWRNAAAAVPWYWNTGRLTVCQQHWYTSNRSASSPVSYVKYSERKRKCSWGCFSPNHSFIVILHLRKRATPPTLCGHEPFVQVLELCSVLDQQAWSSCINLTTTASDITLIYGPA